MQFPTTEQTQSPAVDDVTFSRRGLGKRLLGASAVAVLLAAGKRDDAQAAPVGDPWKLGGNAGVTTTGTNFLGTTDAAPLIVKTANAERMRITPTGNVGIGMTTPSAKLQVYSTTYAIYARHTAATGTHPAVQGETAATVAGASGVLGKVMSTAPGADSAGVLGANKGTNSNGAGVRGSHAGSGRGVHGSAVSGIGVYGTSVSGYALQGSGNGGAYLAGQLYGVVAFTSSLTGYGGLFYNIVGDSTDTTGVGVQGLGSGGTDALIHPDGGLFYDGGGEFSGPNGVIGAAAHAGGYGVIGIQGPGTYAGRFVGDVYISGTLSKSAGTFKIDHPLDPENKYLSHSFVESPDMKNVYDGTVTLDGKGEATVEMPAYFEALNRDFRYQLTTIGGYAPVYIAEEIKGNRFKIAGGTSGMKVSWQVTGIRQDAYAKAHPITVEEDKPKEERGTYLAPEAFGKTADKGVGQQGYKRAPRPAPTAPPQVPRQQETQPSAAPSQ